MKLCGITDKGIVRRQNQDVYKTLYDEDKRVGVVVVCDGMGGAKAGNIASELAAETFIEFLMCRIVADIDEMSLVIVDAVTDVNTILYQKSLSDPECSGMGTTLVAAVVTEGGAVVINVGDSRAYHITDISITQITRDHSVVEDMVGRGDITREQSKTHPNKNLITRALGTDEIVEPDVFRPQLAEGDMLLLCSDGLSNIIEDSEFLYETRHAPTIELACRRLVDLSLNRGAPDNVTAAILVR